MTLSLLILAGLAALNPWRVASTAPADPGDRRAAAVVAATVTSELCTRFFSAWQSLPIC